MACKTSENSFDSSKNTSQKSGNEQVHKNDYTHLTNVIYLIRGLQPITEL